MKSFFKITFASLLGFFIGILIIALILGGIIKGITSIAEKKVEVKPNTVLQIKFDKQISDRGTDNPFAAMQFGSFKPNIKLGLTDIVKSIENAKTDDNIKGIFLNLSPSMSMGSATAEEIHDALVDFKSSEKFIVAYSEIMTQKAYYLVSMADEIYMNPEGAILWTGAKAELMFFKGLLEKLEIEAQIIRGKNNKFKSAVEPFMYDKMSDANREQTETFMGSIWDHLLKEIGEQRNISVTDLKKYADELTIRNPKNAVEYKLIDGTKYYDEVLDILKEKTEEDEIDDIEFLSLAKYIKVPEDREGKDFPKNKIAVIYATGEIGMGQGDDESIGSEKISAAIRKARLDEKVKAIVLRVNSPGGSALASEVILREAMLAKEAKPFIVSMGDVAASGGYYIACDADAIVAQETTITGSIGVFGIIPNFENFMKNKLGITTDRVKTNKHSDLGSVMRPLTEFEHDVIQEEVQNVYDTFLSHVSKGRSKAKEDVDSIGQGRVWSGVNAMKIGLIDEFGGLNRAIELAVEKAGLEGDYRLYELPERKEPLEQIMEELTGEVKTMFIEEELGDTYKYYKKAAEITEMEGIQARMIYDIDIQ